MSQSDANPALDAAELLVLSLENDLALLRAELWGAEQDTDSYRDPVTRAEAYAALPGIQDRIDTLTPLLAQAAAIFHTLDELTVVAR
jgi:hypothetical protein